MALALVAASLVAATLLADGSGEIEVRPGTLRAGDSVQIMLTLNDDLARLDAVSLPTENLIIDSGPSVSSQFQWVNGVVSRQRVFTYIAHAEHPGVARVGPLWLRDARGENVLIRPVSIPILPALQTEGTEPETMLRDLARSGDQQVFVLAETDSKDAMVGEQLVVTWYLYAADPVRDLSIKSMPSLPDFWSEDLPLENEPTREMVIDGVVVQRIPIQRLALFPLHAGTLEIGSLSIAAQVIRPIRDPFGIFSGFNRTVEEVARRSPSIEVGVRPLPVAVATGAVGDFTMSCTPADAPREGPVVVNVSVSGKGNLRAAAPPHLSTPFAGRIDVQDGPVSVSRSEEVIEMTRRWTILLFPAQSGRITVPEVVFGTFSPSAGRLQNLRCGPWTVNATVAKGGASIPPPADESKGRPPRRPTVAELRRVAGGALLVGAALGLFFTFRTRRPRVGKGEVEALIGEGDPAAMRGRLHEMLESAGLDRRELLGEESSLGDAFRALHSWIDVHERETLTRRASSMEASRRARDFLQALRSHRRA